MTFPAPGCRSAREPHPQGVLLGFSRPSGTPTAVVGRRPRRAAMPATGTSTTTFSPDRPAKRPVSAAPGLRGYDHGKVRRVGDYGYNWSSSASISVGTDDYVCFFQFYTTGFGPNDLSYRANGLQLRCLQEHPKGVLLAIRPRKAQPSCAERHPSGTLTDEKRRAAACGLCREKPSLRVPSGTGPPARGGFGPSGPLGRS